MTLLASEATTGRLESALALLRTMADELGQDDCRSAVERTIQSFAEGTLRVAVLGQFKRGKSTLLNVLVGRAVLPTGVLPVTALATEVREGPGTLVVADASPGEREVPLASLADYVTESRNPENAKGIQRVEVRIPLPDWARNVVFVDSPGIASVHDRTTEAARRLLAHVDAAVFVLSPDPPLSAPEREFLAEVAQYASKFFFVLNKVDLVGPDELRDLSDYTRRVLREQCGFPSVRLYPLSARVASEGPGGARGPAGGLGELVADLSRYLDEGRLEALHSSARRRIGQYARRLRDIVDLSLQGFQQSETEFRAALGTLEHEVAELQTERRASDGLLAGDVQEILRVADERLREFQSEAAPPLVAGLESQLAASTAVGGAALVREFDAAFRAALLPRVSEMKRAVEADFSDRLRQAFEVYERRLAALTDRIDRVVADLFRVHMVSVRADVPLALESKYYPHVDGLLEASFSGQTLLALPAALLRRRIRGRLRSQVAGELDAQCGRIRSDLFERSERSVREFRALASAQIDENVERVRQALLAGRSQAAADSGRKDAWKAEQERRRRQLGELLEAFA